MLRRRRPVVLTAGRRALVERAAFTVSMADRAGWPAPPDVVRRALAPLLDDDELEAVDAVEPGDLDPATDDGWPFLTQQPGPRPTADDTADAHRVILRAVRTACRGAVAP
jgi:hypothetical protein